MKKILATFASFAVLMVPVLALAQVNEGVVGREAGTISDLMKGLNGLINDIVPFIVGFAVLVVIFGILSFIVAGADEEKRKSARSYIVWGIVGIFLMLSIWGLVAILANTFAFSQSGKDDIFQGARENLF